MKLFTKSTLISCLFVATMLQAVSLKAQQMRLVKGTVINERGDFLNGANVKVSQGGADIETATANARGIFSVMNLKVGSKYDFIITYVGYETDTVKGFLISADENDVLLVRLKEDASKLTEVVVTALGVNSEKKKLGYAVQEIKSEDFAKAQESNPIGSLVGKIAGLNIYNSHELLTPPTYNIRGNTPLVVVNGVPLVTDFYNINPDDIESISVLKGTAASALYGSRGKDGAIMITTKSGATAAHKTEVEFKTSNQLQAGFIAIPHNQTHYGSGDHGVYTYTNSIYDVADDDAGGGAGSWGPKLDAGLKEVQWDSPIDPTTGNRIPTPWVSRGKDNLKNFIRPGFTTSDNVSLTRKFDNGSIRLSLGQNYQQGQIPNTQLNITDFSVAGTFTVAPGLKTDFSLNYSHEYTNNYPYQGYGRRNIIYNLVVWEGVDTDIRQFRNYWQPGQVGQQQLWYNQIEYNNPWFISYEYLRSLNKNVVFGNYSLSYDVAPGLNITARLAVNNADRFQDLKVPKSFREYSNRPYSFGINGGYQTEDENTFDLNADVLATYNHKFGKHVALSALAGANIRYFQDREQGLKADGLSVPGVYNFANATSALIVPTADVNYNTTNVNYLDKKQVNSWYAGYNLGLYNWIYWDVTGRVDESSTLPVGSNTYFYPSTSLGLVISNVTKLPAFISYAKLRASLAQVALDLPVYSTQQTYSPGQTWNGNTSVTEPTTLLNPNIQPQKTTTQEYGADLRFFNSRLNLDLTYFSSLDKNTIINLPVSVAAGFTTRLENANEYTRKGGEITASGAIIKRKAFQWVAIVNWSTYQQKIKSLDPSLGGNYNGLVVGDNTTKILATNYLHNPDGLLDIAANGLPVTDTKLHSFGNANPLWSSGISNKFSYKQFTLTIDVDGRYGGTIYNTTREKTISAGVNKVTDNEYQRDLYNQGISSIVIPGENVATGANGAVYTPNTTKVTWQQYWGVFGSQPYNWKDASFLKLREVSITYSSPAQSHLAFFKSWNVSLVGRNLFLLSHLDSADPDPGVDNLQTPASRTIGVNFNAKF